MKSKLKYFSFYVILFALFLFWNLISQSVKGDEIWNFGFAYSIAKGEVPYRDFNMVVTPLYPFIMAFGMKIFSINMLTFHIEHALFLTFSVFFLFRLFGKNAFLILLFYFFPFEFSFPSYNSFFFLLFVILLYLESRNVNDYFIGIWIGLIILTKQHVGVFLFLVSVFYLFTHQKGKFFKRIVGVIFPLIIFFIYLLFTYSFSSFMDLCFFGLFDFAGENTSSFNVFYVVSFFLFLVCIYFTVRHKGDIRYYYVLSCFSILIPIVNSYHFQILLCCFMCVFCYEFSFSKFLSIPLFSIILILCTISFYTYINVLSDSKVVYPNSIRHFEYRFLNSDVISFSKKFLKYMDEDDRQIIFLSGDAYYFRIASDQKITYIDLINNGNWGYHGEGKIMKFIKENKNAIFVYDRREDDSNSTQTNKKAIDYILNHAKKIDSIQIFDIYVFE